MQNLPEYISKSQIDNIIDSVGEDVAEAILDEIFHVFSEDSLSTLNSLEKAYDQASSDDLNKAAHHLKGAAINLGLNEIFSIVHLKSLDYSD